MNKLRSALRIVCVLAGLYCVLSAVIQLVAASFNMGAALAFAFGAVLVLGAALSGKIFSAERGRLFKAFRGLCCIGVGAAVIFSAGLFVYGKIDNVSGGEDAVIVLGAGIHGTKISRPLKFRLDKALEYYAENPEAVIVVSGGQGAGEDISEAEAMAAYLEENGVNPERIIKEENSFGTDENLINSREMLVPVLGEDFSAAIVTSGFHTMRAVWTAKRLGMKVTHMGAKIMWYNVPVCYIRECAAFLWYLIK